MAQVQHARLNLQQVVDDEDLDLTIELRQPAGLRQQLVVGEDGNGGRGSCGRDVDHDVNIVL